MTKHPQTTSVPVGPRLVVALGDPRLKRFELLPEPRDLGLKCLALRRLSAAQLAQLGNLRREIVDARRPLGDVIGRRPDKDQDEATAILRDIIAAPEATAADRATAARWLGRLGPSYRDEAAALGEIEIANDRTDGTDQRLPKGG